MIEILPIDSARSTLTKFDIFDENETDLVYSIEKIRNYISIYALQYNRNNGIKYNIIDDFRPCTL